jgi:DNA-directed RNA polymerase specialized sigma24 family protein
MTPAESFDELLRKWQQGDPETVRLFEEYARRLTGLAAKKLGWMQAHTSPQSVVQSVVVTLLKGQERGAFAGRDADALWPLLITLATRKCHDRVRRYLAKCRDVNRDRPLAGPSDTAGPAGTLPSDDPTPDVAAHLNDLLDAVRPHCDDREWRIINLLLKGYSPQEISEGRFAHGGREPIPAEDRLADPVSESTIKRLRKRLEQRWTLLSS